MVIESLFACGRVHEGTGNFCKGRALVGHGIGDNGVVVNGNSDGLAQSCILGEDGHVHVVPCSGHRQADAVRSLFIVGGDGQAVFQPQILDIADELLANVNFAGLQCELAGRVIGIDRMSNILGNRQFAPHGGILAPVIIVTNQNDFLIIKEVLGIRAGPDNVLARVVQDLHGIAAVALNQFVDPGGLCNGTAGQEVSDLQGVDRFAVFANFGVDDKGLVSGGFDGINVGAESCACSIADLYADVPGLDNIFCRNRRAVTPLCSIFQDDGDFCQVIIPFITVCQQADDVAIHEVVHEQGLKHQCTVAGRAAGNCHGVVLVGAHDVPAKDSSPLLTCEIQGLLAGKFAHIVGKCSCTESNKHCQSEQDCEGLFHVWFLLKFLYCNGRGPIHTNFMQAQQKPGQSAGTVL